MTCKVFEIWRKNLKWGFGDGDQLPGKTIEQVASSIKNAKIVSELRIPTQDVPLPMKPSLQTHLR